MVLLFCSGWGAGVSDTVGGEAVDISSLPAVASCRVVASICKMVASGTLVPHRLWVDRPAGLPHRHTGMLGDPALPLLSPHTPTLACFPCAIFPRCRHGLPSGSLLP